MPPRGQQLRIVDPVLTQLTRGYSNAQFVGKYLFPIVDLDKETGKIPSFGKESFLLFNTARAMRANSNKMPVEDRATIDFATEEHDVVYPVDYREQAEDIFNTEQYAALRAQDAILLKHEYICAQLAQNAANFPTGNKITLAGTAQFTDAGSDPFLTIDNAKEAVRNKIAKRPNVAVIGAAAFKVLKNHAKVLERIKYTQRGVVTADLLKSLFDLDELYVGDSVYMTDAGVVTDMWADNIILAYVPQAKGGVRSYFEPSFAYTLRKKNHPEVDKYDEEGGKIMNIRSTDNFVAKIVGSDAGYLISDTNA